MIEIIGSESPAKRAIRQQSDATWNITVWVLDYNGDVVHRHLIVLKVVGITMLLVSLLVNDARILEPDALGRLVIDITDYLRQFCMKFQSAPHSRYTHPRSRERGGVAVARHL